MQHNKVKEFFDIRAEDWNNYQTESKAYLEELISYLPIKKGMKVLDLACGTGKISEILASLSLEKVVAIDLSEKMIDVAKHTHDNPNIDFRCEDFYKMTKEKFNFIVCFNAYPHFLDINGFAKKANELLISGGYLAIMHSCGRVEIDKHHDAFAANVSRHLKSPKDEYMSYKDYFVLDKELDEKDKYLMLLKKVEN